MATENKKQKMTKVSDRLNRLSESATLAMARMSRELKDQGKDVIAQAQSGTGKTGAFVIGSLEIIDESLKQTQVIIVSPTRELSRQNFQVVNAISQFQDMSFSVRNGSP